MTEQEIKIRAICAILTGRTSNPDYADISISTIVSEAIHASDLLITELWKDEQLTPPDTITQMNTVPILCNPSDTMDTRKAVKGFQTFEAHSTDFRSPIGASTPFSKIREIFRSLDTRKSIGVHHNQRDR